MKEKKIILFTGGLDSTFSLIKNLSEGYDVDAVIIDSVNFPNTKQQKEAVKNIYELLDHSRLHSEVVSKLGVYEGQFTIPSFVYGTFNPVFKSGYLQISSFINGAIYRVSEDYKNDIIISYNKDDDIVKNNIWILNEIKQIIRSLSKTQLICCDNIDELVTVSYPLISYSKEKIVESLIELSVQYNIGSNNQLLKTIRWCETSYDRTCIERGYKDFCMCNSCKCMKKICEKYNLF